MLTDRDGSKMMLAAQARPAVDPAAPVSLHEDGLARWPMGPALRWLEGGRMTAPVSRPAARTARSGRLGWLPPGGYGNGLDDATWAPVLEISEQVVADVLGALASAGVPGYAAQVRPPGGRLRDRSPRPDTWRLWVGASAYGTAEAVLLAVMPRLAREAARHTDRAWR
jgi:hypothetical protein